MANTAGSATGSTAYSRAGASQAEIIEGQLRVDVVDTGVGLPDGDIFGSSKNGSGLGLDNIRNRLAMRLLGASRMELRSGHEGGTLVRLSISYQPQTHS